MIICAVLSLISDAELKKAGIDTGKDTIVIYAAADTLEHFVMCANFVRTFERKKIEIIIDGGAENASELEEIAQNLCKRYKNITYERR
ncbi:MAG: hypothetical protein KBS59_04750 [Clostridiales bacterium]|nr:hypothetical protein [Clostridiales bacterium]